MKYKEIIKKIDFADECNKEIARIYGKNMLITMEEAFVFKQLLEEKLTELKRAKVRVINNVNC